MSLWDSFLQSLTSSWFDSGTQSLKQAIQILSATPWPDLTVSWFKTFWNSIFGLAGIVAIIAILIHSVIFMFRSKQGYSLVGSLAILGRTFLSGLFGLVLVYGVITLSALAIQGLILLGNIGTSGTNWMDTFYSVTNGQLVDIWSKVGNAWLGMAGGRLLSAQAQVANVAIYTFALYSLFTASLGQSKLMQWVRSLLHAALWTAIIGRVFQIAWLVIMSVVIHKSLSNDEGNADQILVAIVGAALIPVVIFIGLTFRAITVEGKLDVRRNLRESEGARTSGATEAEIIEKRSQKVSGLKTAAISAATAGAVIGSEKLISKAIAPIIAKLSGVAHPAAPYIIMGVQAAATATTAKIRQKMASTSDRVGNRRR